MHLLIDDEREYSVDIVARTAREGKRALREKPITSLYMDHDLGCDGKGYDVLAWAERKQLLPMEVVLITNHPIESRRMALLLKANGYASNDGFRFIRVR